MQKLGTMLPTLKVNLRIVIIERNYVIHRHFFFAGFFPAEMVFTERAIPVLVEQGIEWVMVANNHISRACKVKPTLILITKIDIIFPTPSEINRTTHTLHMVTIIALPILLIRYIILY